MAAISFIAAVTIYILAEPNLALGRFIPYHIALIVGFSLTALLAGFYVFRLLTRKEATPDEPPSEEVTEAAE